MKKLLKVAEAARAEGATVACFNVVCSDSEKWTCEVHFLKVQVFSDGGDPLLLHRGSSSFSVEDEYDDKMDKAEAVLKSADWNVRR